jgi:hypothetical protein
MRQFNPLLFRLYASDIEQAILGLSRERMGVHETRQALNMPDLTMSYSGDKEVWTNGKDSVEVPPGASHSEIEQAFKATPMPAVEILPPTTRAVDTAPLSNVTGLQFGAFQSALGQIRERIAAKQTQAINKIVGTVTEGEARIEAAGHAMATKIDKEISAALQEFAQHTNGGPE